MRFVDEDKMTPVQLALETARYQFTLLHGSTISYPGMKSYVFDDTEVNARIDAAIRFLKTKDTPSDQRTACQ